MEFTQFARTTIGENLGLVGWVTRAVALVAVLVSLIGCASMQPHDFASSPTSFELDQFFVGHCKSWGVFENPNGTPRRYFTCDNVGQRGADGAVTLTQHFRFSDGRTQQRVWRIRRVDQIHWEATANDLVGVARGEGQGNALSWEYTITANPKNPLATVHIRQWMYQPEGTQDLMTRLVVTKLGVELFEVSEVIHHV